MAELLKNQLDEPTRITLENSLAMQVLNLFAIIAMADKVLTEEEEKFVHSYCDLQYPAPIANYLYDRFEEFSKLYSRDRARIHADIHRITDQINKRLSYQEKVFCLLKLYELLMADEAEEHEVEIAHEIADRLLIRPPDLFFLESVSGISPVDKELSRESSFIQITVAGDSRLGDVFLPKPGLHLEIFKIYNLYCLLDRSLSLASATGLSSPAAITVDEHPLRPGSFTRIPHNAKIKIEDYEINYQDLKIYFENKVHPLQANLYLSHQGGDFSWSKVRLPESSLYLNLTGSHVELSCLKDTGECLVGVNGAAVGRRQDVYVNLNDRVMVDGHRLNLREIFFHLNREKVIRLDPDKTVYEITNDGRGDIFIADDLTDKWSVRVTREPDHFTLDRGDYPYRILVNGRKVQGVQTLTEADSVLISNRYLFFNPAESTIRQNYFSFEKLAAQSVRYAFDDGTQGLDNVSFDISYGDLVAIMGPSGCGKSTLLTIISGFSRPEDGSIYLGEKDLHEEYKTIKDYLGYVPQDDLLLANLTVYENLYYYAKLRFPDQQRSELDPRIDLVLKDVGLFHKKHTKVGSPVDKTLSGGERKRLNIGLELLANAEVYLLDEPTSGLSSKDSENIVELLSDIAARGKIVLTVIHQPSSKLFKMFNKLVLLDKGGRLVYFGDTYGALDYFQSRKDAAPNGFTIECPVCKSVQPDLLLDTLEESLRDIDGARLSERKYSPDYWKEQFEAYRKTEEEVEARLPAIGELPPAQALTLGDRLDQFRTLLARTFRSKLRDRSNLWITFLGAPLLGFSVSFVTKYSPQPPYTLLQNDLFSIFLFTSVIVAMFFGMTNSVDEIINDRGIFMRERMLSLQNRSYLASKLIVLSLFAMLQNALYVGVGFWVLGVRELFIAHILYLSLVSFAGISLGLLISSIPGISTKAAQNIIPLVLIPQIILGGSLIVFEDMNQDLRLFSKSPIPEVCQVMPSRWGFEGVIILQAVHNRYDRNFDVMMDELNNVKRDRKSLKDDRDKVVAEIGEQAYQREMAQKTTAMKDAKKALDEFRDKFQVTYSNNRIRTDVSKAEASFNESDSRVFNMFVRSKSLPFGGPEISTVYYNALVILLIAMVLNSCTLLMLRFKDEVQRMMRQASRVRRALARH